MTRTSHDGFGPLLGIPGSFSNYNKHQCTEAKIITLHTWQSIKSISSDCLLLKLNGQLITNCGHFLFHY